MKRYILITALISCISVLCLAQAAEAPFNNEKSRQELEIMKGIIGKSIDFSLSDGENVERTFRISDINAFYLSGQGAVFVIPSSGFSMTGGLLMPEVSLQVKALSEQAQLLSERMKLQSRAIQKKAQELERQFERNRSPNDSYSRQPSPPPASLAPPTSPTPPTPPVPERAPLEKLYEIESAFNRSKMDLEALKEEYRENLEKAKAQLIETLANYGDSLSIVKPGEYINLVLISGDPTTGAFIPNMGRQAIHEVITVKKSWVSDFKAGRLSLENFKQKVLQYGN